jgi:endonuclease/exonuclease/phosphatase family metal-dependent hydrolase
LDESGAPVRTLFVADDRERVRACPCPIVAISDVLEPDTAFARITKADTHQPRRIDRIYVTHNVPAQAVAAFRVVDAAEVGQCTDHRPVEATLDETLL